MYVRKALSIIKWRLMAAATRRKRWHESGGGGGGSGRRSRSSGSSNGGGSPSQVCDADVVQRHAGHERIESGRQAWVPLQDLEDRRGRGAAGEGG